MHLIMLIRNNIQKNELLVRFIINNNKIKLLTKDILALVTFKCRKEF